MLIKYEIHSPDSRRIETGVIKARGYDEAIEEILLPSRLDIPDDHEVDVFSRTNGNWKYRWTFQVKHWREYAKPDRV